MKTTSKSIKKIELLLGEALSKSLEDPFNYALKLRTGEVLLFEDARLINEQWIHIVLNQDDPQPSYLAYPAPRGIDVRISDIVWVMDGPLESH